ncbi:hypothetical protein PanWU01x14_134880 [Parasponia andersonii]|uniref:Uncharacterized protein n=1 Tax=Parasponia andersonii TaxID=3476 RepID=A0A2P5CP63_PARAD|nr:hypothetical protein PanWU01x14_134880 [Parasponia andersonii]
MSTATVPKIAYKSPNFLFFFTKVSLEPTHGYCSFADTLAAAMPDAFVCHDQKMRMNKRQLSFPTTLGLQLSCGEKATTVAIF